MRRYVNNLRSAKSAVDRNDRASAAELLGQAFEDAELAARFEGRFLNNLAVTGRETAVEHLKGWDPAISVGGTMLGYRQYTDLIVRDLTSGGVIRKWSNITDGKRQEHKSPRPVAFTYGDQHLIATDSAGSSFLLSVEAGAVVGEEILHSRMRAGVRSVDGSSIAAITDEGVAIIDCSGELKLRDLFGEPEYYYSALAMSPDGQLLALAENVPHDLNRPELGIKRRSIIILEVRSGSVLDTVIISGKTPWPQPCTNSAAPCSTRKYKLPPTLSQLTRSERRNTLARYPLPSTPLSSTIALPFARVLFGLLLARIPRYESGRF